MAINTKSEVKPYSETHIANQSFDPIFQVSVMESVGYDGQSLQRMNASNMAIRIEYDGSSNPIYIGIAAPGVLNGDSYWQIRKLTFDGNNNVTAIQYASGTSNFDKIWDSRSDGTYTYS